MKKNIKSSDLELKIKSQLFTGYNDKTREIKELEIEPVAMVDGPSGVRNYSDNSDGGCVCFPSASAVGASWSRDVAFKVGASLGRECRRLGYEMLLGPGLNMKRTPYCGRNFEYFSEDPVLTGHMAAALVNGLETEGIGSSLKHFAANNQEYNRGTYSAEIDERTLRELYLKPFEIAIKNSNPTSVMCAYNKLNGIWCSENKYLLTDILRDEWGYDGVVISDWGAVHDACKAIKAGLNIDMPCNNNILEDLRKGLKNGTISEEEIDKSADRVLAFINRIKDMQIDGKEYCRQAEHNVAYDAAIEGITLLQNDDNILPITSDKYKKIAVFGRAAQIPLIMGAGSGKVNVNPKMIDKPIDYMIKYAKAEGINLQYDRIQPDGYMGAEDIAKINDLVYSDEKYDMMVLFISNNFGSDTETEHWDRENLTFPNYVNGMVDAACNVCDNVVVVMQSGSAMLPGRWYNRVKGVVQMWFSGEAGGKAVADILFGYQNPSGKLSETFAIKDRMDIEPYGDGRITCYREGLYVGYRYYDRHKDKIWFPFGHGLSYTQFEYSDLDISLVQSEPGKLKASVSCKVKNIGKVAGKEVVELYLSQSENTVDRPDKELKGFKKVHLEPGEIRTVTFTLSESDFAYYNICLKKWHVESGTYNIKIGASSADIRLSKSCSIVGTDEYSINKGSTRFAMLGQS